MGKECGQFGKFSIRFNGQPASPGEEVGVGFFGGGEGRQVKIH